MFMSILKSIQMRGAVNLEKTGNFDARKPDRNKRKNQKFPVRVRVRDQNRDQIKAEKTGIF